MYIGFHPYVSILHMFRKTYFDVSNHVFKFWFYQNLFSDLLSNTSIYHLLGVSDSIHTYYASNVFQYLVLVSVQVSVESVFHLKV